jgi:ATP-dependent DNA helicase RecG
MPEPSQNILEWDKVNIEDLLKRQEDEYFDRTQGGQDNIGKAIAAFGTKNGGVLLIGQEDFKHGGRVHGIGDESAFQADFSNAVQNVNPRPLTRQEIIKYGEVKLAVIRIQNVGALKPCSYLSVYYERKGDTNAKLSPQEVRNYHLLFGLANPENMPTHAKKSDIDETELELYSHLLKKTKNNILHSVLSNSGFLTVRGAVVLSKEPDKHLEGSFVEVQRYDSIMGSSPLPLGSPVKISKPARQMIEETARIIAQNLPVTRAYEGARMMQGPAIPESVIREAVTNAVAHRNYHSHEHIRIRIYADGFDISNPAAITPRMWEDIEAMHIPYHPNEGIYTFLNPALLYEGKGEGIQKMREELARLGKTAPEFMVIGELPSTFYVRISLSPAKKKDVKRQKLEELLLKKTELTTSDVMHYLQVSRVTAINLLNGFVAQNRLEHTGNARSSKYIIRKI